MADVSKINIKITTKQGSELTLEQASNLLIWESYEARKAGCAAAEKAVELRAQADQAERDAKYEFDKEASLAEAAAKLHTPSVEVVPERPAGTRVVVDTRLVKTVEPAIRAALDGLRQASSLGKDDVTLTD